MSRYLVDQIERHADVEVRLHAEVRELVGPAGHLQALAVEDVRTGRVSRVDATLLFVFIGTRPRTDWLQGSVDLDDHGYISTVSTGGRQALETSRPGVFAAGDVRSGSIKRVTAAMGEGATAVRLVHEHLARTGRTARR
jgi:thioredoxin reductase (NADPH)